MEDIQQLLALSDRPAFCVENGIVTAANDAARARQIKPNDRLEALLPNGSEALSEFGHGFLCLTLTLLGQQIPATVSALGSRLIFTLEPEQVQEEFRLLSLASQSLREPLGDVIALVEQLNADPEQIAGINRGLHRLLRLVGNMSPHPPIRLEMSELNHLLDEFYEKTKPACQSRGIQFHFISNPTPVYTYVDDELLRRAMYNLLSNAIKFSQGGTITLQLTQSRRFCRISLQDSGSRLPDFAQDPFACFLREPGTGDPRRGIGLGMHLVRSAAQVHGGTVLMDTPPEGGVRVTLTLSMQQNGSGIRSPRILIPHTGEWDPMLVELSDVLPTDFYL